VQRDRRAKRLRAQPVKAIHRRFESVGGVELKVSRTRADALATAVTQAEILHGVMLLPRGKRREAIASAAAQMFEERTSRSECCRSGSDAALAYAEIASARRRRGRPISAFDAQIAAIARSAGAQLATRNVDDFEGCGIDIVDPWQET
jgi:toxin FitB